MRYCPDGLRALLAPSYQTEETDRIIQSVFWGQTENVQDVKNGKGFERNFNINLGGNASNQYAPIISVQRDAQKIDIYTVPFAQFLADFDPAFTGPVSHFSRYEMRANGMLKIRRIILIPDIKKNGISVGNYQLYYEQWNPFLFSNTTFNRMAYHLYKDGTPNANYLLESPALNAENPIPYYHNTDVDQTQGYVVLYQNGAAKTAPVVGMVYGTKNAVVQGNMGAQNKINSMRSGNVVALLPALYVYNTQGQSILDYVYYIVPRSASTPAFKTLLESLVAEIPAPHIYGPGTQLPAELKTIAGNLVQNLSKPGVRTAHLASFAP
jgi:hypothetical protein